MQNHDTRTTDVYARTSLCLRRALGIGGVSFASLGSGPQLMAFRAPPRLIEASQRASLDEHRHARFCFAEAARHAGRRVEPGPLEMGHASAAVSFEEFMLLI